VIVHCKRSDSSAAAHAESRIGAANRFPDKCDADPEAARALNVEATKSLAKTASSRGIFLIYISTDYVFPGKPGEAPYENHASTQPPNLYGQTKLDGEKVTLEENKEKHLGVVLRVPVLYGAATNPGESAVNVLSDKVWKAQEKDAKIDMDDWAQRYPTNTEDVGRICKDIAVKYTEASESERAQMPKVLQFSSEDRYTKYGICKMMAEILGLPLDGMVAVKEGSAPGTGVQRPYDTHLSTKALKDLGVDVWTQNFTAWWYVTCPVNLCHEVLISTRRRELHAFRH